MAGVFLLDCPHCPATNSSFSLVWAAFHNGRWQTAATCGACGAPVVALFSASAKYPNNAPSGLNGNVVALGYAFQGAWPVREIQAAPPFTPDGPRKRFLDGEFTFQNGRYNAAAGMYRSALDLATKDLKAEGRSFYDRLQWLRDKDRITADILEWAKHVRIDGNGALHDEEDVTKEDATALRHFTTMFLRYVYEMPGLVAQFRKPEA